MMAKKRRNRLLVPDAHEGMERLKQNVMSRQVGASLSPEKMKTEIAHQVGIPYNSSGYNGDLKASQAGKIGGKVGGQMVKEMIRMAQKELVRRKGDL